MNLANTIIPRSDQLNSDELMAGPITIKITAVDSGSAEQPVVIHYENEKGHPYKPSKSMRRVLVSIWGNDGNLYVGRKLTLYRDPLIKFGGEPVGGIRISHASDIDEPVQIALTETRGKRKPFTVEPLKADKPKQLENLPADWPNWSNEERGANRASLGIDALQNWWATLSADEKKALKPRLDGEWKPNAQKKGATS